MSATDAKDQKEAKLAMLVLVATHLGERAYSAPTPLEALSDEQKLSTIVKLSRLTYHSLIQKGARMVEALNSSSPLARDPTAFAATEPSEYLSDGPAWHDNSCAFDTLLWLSKQLHLGNTVMDYSLNADGCSSLSDGARTLRRIVRLPGWEGFKASQKQELVAKIREVCMRHNPDLVTFGHAKTPAYASLMKLWHILALGVPQTTYILAYVEDCGQTRRGSKPAPRCGITPVETQMRSPDSPLREIVEDALNREFWNFGPERQCKVAAKCKSKHPRQPALYGEPPCTLAVGPIDVAVQKLLEEQRHVPSMGSFEVITLRYRDKQLNSKESEYELQGIVYYNGNHYFGDYRLSDGNVISYDGLEHPKMRYHAAFAHYWKPSDKLGALVYRKKAAKC